MTLYFWEAPYHYSDKLMAMYDDSRSPNRVLFMYGQAVAPEQVTSRPILRFTAPKQKLKEWDCLVNTVSQPIVNPRTAALLQALAPEDVQLIPVKVVCDDGVSLDYVLANITLIRCLASIMKNRFTHCILKNYYPIKSAASDELCTNPDAWEPIYWRVMGIICRISWSLPLCEKPFSVKK